MSTDATHNGHAARAGNPTSGKNTAATIAAPIEIKTVVASGSSPPLIVAFQPAWQAAASSTAAKTNESMARRIHAACEQARTINPGTPLPTIPRRGALVLLWAGDLGAECVLTYFRRAVTAKRDNAKEFNVVALASPAQLEAIDGVRQNLQESFRSPSFPARSCPYHPRCRRSSP